MKLKAKILDFYFKMPVIIDIVITTVIWYISKYKPISTIKLSDKTNQLNVLSSLIGTNVSLAGFILAALTIIVTFKSNLKVKGIEDSDNALELILSSKHYEKIVAVFKNALLEFVLCFIVLYLFWTISDNLSIATIYRVGISGIVLTAMTIIRSLFILFVILKLERHKRG